MIYRDVADPGKGRPAMPAPTAIRTYKVQIFSLRTNYVLYDAAA